MDTDVRSQILQVLYTEWSKPFAQALEYGDLAKVMKKSLEEIQREGTYLEEKGYLLNRERTVGVRVFRTLQLTAKGIDFVEGRDDGKAIQVAGDMVHITVGDNAQNLALGMDIVQDISQANSQTLMQKLDKMLVELLDFLSKQDSQDKDIVMLKQQATILRESLQNCISVMQMSCPNGIERKGGRN